MKFFFKVAPIVALLAVACLGQLAPQSYSARSDNCVTGSESGCTGAPTGHAGSALSFLLRNSDTVPFADVTLGTANMSSTGTDPDFNSRLVMATDPSTGANCLGSGSWPSWNMGSAGEYDAFSQDSSLLMVHNNAGNVCILFLNPTAIHAGTCATASPACVSLTSGTVATSPIGSVGSLNTYNLAANGSWNFSRASGETNILYELENPPTKIDKVAICVNGAASPNCSAWVGPGPLLRTVYQDFTSETGSAALPLRYVPAGWTSTFVSANDGSVAFGMGGGQDWLASWTPTVNETFLFPQTNAPSGSKGFQATTVSSATGSSEPNWASSCPSTGNTCTDGGVTWTNIGNIGGQGPGFDVVGYSPSQGSWRLNTRIAKIYRGTGNSAPAGATTTNDNVGCTRAAMGGTITYPCSLPDEYTLHDLSQAQNGRYVIISPTGGEGANAPGNFNSGTLQGQKSNATWAYGVGSGTGAYSGSITYAVNDVVSNGGCYFTARTSTIGNAPPSCNPAVLTQNTQWTETEAYPLNYIFDITTTNLAPCTDYTSCGGHQAQGYTEKAYGAHFENALYSSPVVNGQLNPGTRILPTALPCDFHGSWRQNRIDDSAPIAIINTCVPAWSTAYTQSGYGEIELVKPDGSGLTYRITSDYNTGSSDFFQDQNNIGVVSYLGDLIAFGTDMMGKRGDQAYVVSGVNKTCQNPVRGMYQPSTLNSVSYQDTMMVLSTNYIYKAVGFYSGTFPSGSYVTTGTGTEGASLPSWASVCGTLNSYCTTDGTNNPATGQPSDGNVLWQNTGENSCRSDVVIVDALSATGISTVPAKAAVIFAKNSGGKK